MTLEECIDLYCTAWSETDPVRRKNILENVLMPNATYTDPTVKTTGTAELVTHITNVLVQRQGSKVLRISNVDMHHGFARFAWHMVKADGTALPAGIDIVEVDEASGKLKSILGFFGPLKDLKQSPDSSLQN